MGSRQNMPPVAKLHSRRWHARAWTHHLRGAKLYQLIVAEVGEDDPRAQAALHMCGWTNELVGMLDPDNPKMSAEGGAK